LLEVVALALNTHAICALAVCALAIYVLAIHVLAIWVLAICALATCTLAIKTLAPGFRIRGAPRAAWCASPPASASMRGAPTRTGSRRVLARHLVGGGPGPHKRIKF
jgi:hypothetical protein